MWFLRRTKILEQQQKKSSTYEYTMYIRHKRVDRIESKSRNSSIG